MIMIWVLLLIGIFLTAIAQWGYIIFNLDFEDAVMQSFAGIAMIILFGVLYSMEKKN